MSILSINIKKRHMVNSKIRVGVIGLGYLGKFHFEKYRLNKSVNLTSIVDIDKENLDVGDRVALHRQTLAVLETLPSTKDPLVMGAEVDSKPTENYSDIGGLIEEVDELRSTV